MQKDQRSQIKIMDQMKTEKLRLSEELATAQGQVRVLFLYESNADRGMQIRTLTEKNQRNISEMTESASKVLLGSEYAKKVEAELHELRQSSQSEVNVVLILKCHLLHPFADLDYVLDATTFQRVRREHCFEVFGSG